MNINRKFFGVALLVIFFSLLSHSANARDISFMNNCHDRVYLAITILEPSGWQTYGWIPLGSCRHDYLNVGGHLTTNSPTFYYYAEKADGSGSWGGNDYTTYVNGREVNMKKSTFEIDSEGDYDYWIKCESTCEDCEINCESKGCCGE